MKSVYLDNNATTAVDPEVLEAMLPFYTEHFGNPSSAHRHGSHPAAKLRACRNDIAAFLGCSPGELTFTSCGTESNNLAIRGILDADENKRHIITCSVEHSAVLNPVKRMRDMGYDVTILPVDSEGQIDLQELEGSIRDDTALVTIMYANNETGVLLPVDRIAEIVAARGVPYHSDTVQAIGKLPLDLGALPVDSISVSGHKLHAPKGVGLLYIRKGTRCRPVLLGGTQEKGRRPGTENVAGIAGLAKACELAAARIENYPKDIRALRDRFEQTILSEIPGTAVNGAGAERLPNTTNIRFDGVTGGAMLMHMDEVGIYASAGSACKSGAGEPSHVLSAMGLTPEQARSSVRFSLGGETKSEDIDYALDHITRIVNRLRKGSPQAAGQ